MMHKASEHQQPLYMCFVDFKKAFHSTSHDKLWQTMINWYVLCTWLTCWPNCTGNSLLRSKREHYQNGFMLRKESNKVVSFLRTCSTSKWRWWWGRPSMDFKVDYKLVNDHEPSLHWWHHPVGHFGGRTTGVGGSPRPSQPQIQPTYQRRQDQGNGERWHSVLHTHSEWTTRACGYVPVPWFTDYRRWWVYNGIPYQVKQRAGDRGITAENMEKSQHTNFN